MLLVQLTEVAWWQAQQMPRGSGGILHRLCRNIDENGPGRGWDEKQRGCALTSTFTAVRWNGGGGTSVCRVQGQRLGYHNLQN
jgi:hypothetical protein